MKRSDDALDALAYYLAAHYAERMSRRAGQCFNGEFFSRSSRPEQSPKPGPKPRVTILEGVYEVIQDDSGVRHPASLPAQGLPLLDAPGDTP